MIEYLTGSLIAIALWSAFLSYTWWRGQDLLIAEEGIHLLGIFLGSWLSIVMICFYFLCFLVFLTCEALERTKDKISSSSKWRIKGREL